MKRVIILATLCAYPIFCMAQPGLAREYGYDDSGNRTFCKVINLVPALTPPPQDTTDFIIALPLDEEELPSMPPDFTLPDSPQYYTEFVAQKEIKIYPNPTTENVTLEIAGWKNLQKGIFKLYSLNGQLLQEYSVISVTTTISLDRLVKGAYILKVFINDDIEEWKIIKN